MIAPLPTPTASTGAMNVIASLLEARTGQQVAANRAWRIEAALKPLLRDQRFDSLDALVAELTTAGAGPLADQVIEALLNQETSFFRDAGVIDAAIDAVAEMATQTPAAKLRIWSAGCSTGQEPLSLAMLLDERIGRDAAMPDIVATDVSPHALTRARAGRYSQFEIQRGLPIRRMLQWFDTEGGEWVAKPELVSRIQFRRHNLATELAPAGRFDLILCRNVLFYFSGSLRQRVFEQLALALRPGGLLVLGAGETVIGQTEVLAPSPQRRGFYCCRSDGVARTAVVRAR